MTTGRIFDRIIVMRWSAATLPTRGDASIWHASMDVVGGRGDCVNIATRSQGERALIADLTAHVGRVLVGFDFPFGFPHGFAGRIANQGANWRAAWSAVVAEVVDGSANDDNRWDAAERLNGRSGMSPGPFFGCPPDQARTNLPTDRPATFFGLESRLAQRRLRARGIRTESTWRLDGPRAPGSLSLLGIPMLRRLGEHPELSRRVRVWPFETGCTSTPTQGTVNPVVLAEVWPDTFEFADPSHSLADAAAAIGACQHLAGLDRAGRLGELFAPTLSPAETAAVEREEGWILGA
jgi:hypothetical protein